MELREAFVVSCLGDGANVSELCRWYGISRKTGYKWLARYRAEGRGGLEDRSRAPRGNRRRVSAEIEEMILAERDQHPRMGAGKLLARLGERHPELCWPARSTVHEILRRGGRVVPGRRRRSAVAGPSHGVCADVANAVWSVDFKGEFKMGDGRYCYPLTVMDGATRYVLSCRALASVKGAGVCPWMDRLFLEYGLPECILSDNGSPFGSRGAGGLTGLSAHWVKLGILLARIRPGHPEENGRHERFHRTLKEATTRPPSYDLASQERQFASFVREYNEERPHEALGQIPPSRLYMSSPREWDGVVPEIEYPGHWETRSVRTSGEIKWRGKLYYLGESLVGERVGLFESADGVWQVAYGTHPVALYEARKDQLSPVKAHR